VTRFRRGQRVVVADPGHHLYQRKGTVIQVRDRDGAARVRIERGLPPGQSIVLDGIEYHDETILFPGHCELTR
jgi:ribosomal protein L35AE/L33A